MVAGQLHRDGSTKSYRGRQNGMGQCGPSGGSHGVHVSPESGHGLTMDQFDNSRVILTSPLIWPCCKPRERRAVAEALKNPSYTRAVPGLSQHCHLPGPSRQTVPNRAVCVTRGACSEISCPHLSQEQGARRAGRRKATPADPKRSLCKHEAGRESEEPLEPLYCHSTAQRSQPTPGPSSRGDLGQGLAEEAADLLPTFLLDH